MVTPSGSAGNWARLRRPWLAGVFATVAALAMAAGCGGGSSSSSGKTASTGGGSASHPPPTTATSVPVTLNHDEFVTKLNQLCRDTNAKRPPDPNSSDPNALANFVEANLKASSSFLPQAEALIANQPDRSDLEANWLSLFRDELAIGEPLGQQFISAVRSGQTAQAGQLLQQLVNTPDQHQQIKDYLNNYGLNDCAGPDTI